MANNFLKKSNRKFIAMYVNWLETELISKDLRVN